MGSAGDGCAAANSLRICRQVWTGASPLRSRGRGSGVLTARSFSACQGLEECPISHFLELCQGTVECVTLDLVSQRARTAQRVESEASNHRNVALDRRFPS